MFGIIKVLERLRRGMNCAMVSPDLEHFKKSLWPEFRRWCPWDRVVPKHRYRQDVTWQPPSDFELVLNNDVGGQSVLICGGIQEHDAGRWEGPNLSFVHLDEIRRHRTPIALKTFDGRVRIPGPRGEPPQIIITTTPRKHWLYAYFGGAPGDDEPPHADDERAAFKRQARVIILPTAGNLANLEPNFVERRGLSLSEAEKRVLLWAGWEDIENAERFLPSIILWDNCREKLPPLGPHGAMVLALDAAVSNDSFGIVGVTRHPSRLQDVAVRYAQKWQAAPGRQIDFQGTKDAPGPEMMVRRLCKQYNVVLVTYDRTELHDMMTRLKREGVAWVKEFPQQAQRLEADKQLFDLILSRRIAHDGNRDLRQHLDNADRKPDADNRRLRIVKREDALKNDLAVALSMAAFECLRLAL